MSKLTKCLAVSAMLLLAQSPAYAWKTTQVGSPSGDPHGDRRPCFFFQSDVVPGQWWAIPYGDGTSVAQLMAAKENINIVTDGLPSKGGIDYIFYDTGNIIPECGPYHLADFFQR